MRPVVERRFVGQGAGRDLGHDLAVVAHPELAVVGDVADGDGVEAPLPEDLEDLVLAALLGHQQHALLAIRRA